MQKVHKIRDANNLIYIYLAEVGKTPVNSVRLTFKFLSSIYSNWAIKDLELYDFILHPIQDMHFELQSPEQVPGFCDPSGNLDNQASSLLRRIIRTKETQMIRSRRWMRYITDRRLQSPQSLIVNVRPTLVGDGLCCH